MFVQAEAGTERWVRWAKAKLAQLAALRHAGGLLALVKTYFPENGVQVWVKSSEFGSHIRITGGAAGRVIRSVTGSILDIFRVSGRVQYGRPTDASQSPVMSWLGDTILYNKAGAAPAALRAARKNRAAQDLADTMAITMGTAMPYRWQSPNLTGLLNRAGQGWLSEDGKLAHCLEAVASLPYKYPRTYRLASDDKSDTATLFSAVLTGQPQPYKDQVAATQAASGDYFTFAGASSLVFLRTNWKTGVPYYYAFGSPRDISVEPLYDPERDRLLLHLRADYPESISAVPDGIGGQNVTAYSAYHSVLYELDPVALTWSEIARREVPHASHWTWNEDVLGNVDAPGGSMGTLNGLTVWAPGSFSNPVDIGTTFADARTTYATSVKGLPAALAWPVAGATMGFQTSGGALVGSLADTQATQLQAWAPSGILASRPVPTNMQWQDVPTGAVVTLATTDKTQVFMSSSGRQLWWLDLSGKTFAKLYANGTLRRTLGGPVPAANATTFATYGADSPDGFYFLEYDPVVATGDNVLWSRDREAFKAKRYVRISSTAATLQGGIIHTSLFGDIPVPSASADGFTFETPVRYQNNSGVLFTEAEFGAAIGDPSVTFAPNGTPAGGSYSWVTATSLIQYDPDADSFRVLKDYTGSTATTEDPGTPGSPGVTLTDAQLVQDEFLPHRS